MLVDANLLLYARDEVSPFHDAARRWLTEQLQGTARVGLPWPSLLAFMRIATHPRASANPMSPAQARQQVDDWLASPVAWVPQPTAAHAEILGDLVTRYQLRAGLVSDGHMAALALEHGIELCSADTDFARFKELRWRNPIA